jgi:membrane fusion protein (multidrug efflux system)
MVLKGLLRAGSLGIVAIIVPLLTLPCGMARRRRADRPFGGPGVFGPMTPSLVDAGDAPPVAPEGRWIRRFLIFGGWALALMGIVVGVGMIGQFAFYRFTRSMTNDAFVESHIVHLSPQVGGLITRVLVEEHDRVKAGQVLAEVDPTPHQRELDMAGAKREVAEATLRLEEATRNRMIQEYPRKVALAEKDLAVAESFFTQAETQLKLTTQEVDQEIRLARAAVESAEAVQIKTHEDYDRYKRLFEERSAPERKFQDVTRDYRMAEADLEGVRSKLSKAETERLQVEIAQLGIVQKGRAKERAAEQVRLARLGELLIEEQRRVVDQRRAQVAEASRSEEAVRTSLQYTQIVAPFDAVIVRRYRNPGDHGPVGATVLSLYDPELVYVTAYMEEERLEGIAPGNPVRVWCDAISGSMEGRVVWIERATGANFALLPRDVSSGEFTKVTQRVPIRIAIERGKHWNELRPGLSATVAISHGLGDPAWAAREADRQRALGSRGVSPLQANPVGLPGTSGNP